MSDTQFAHTYTHARSVCQAGWQMAGRMREALGMNGSNKGTNVYYLWMGWLLVSLSSMLPPR